MKIKSLLPEHYDPTFPPDHAEASIEYELLNVLSSASQNLCMSRSEFSIYIDDLIDRVYENEYDRQLDAGEL